MSDLNNGEEDLAIFSNHITARSEKASFFKERINQFIANVDSLSPCFTMQSAHSHGSNFAINKDNPHFLNDFKPFISYFWRMLEVL